MKLHHLRNLIAVVERGSLRAGARHLGLAQPAMSRSIKELEKEFGLILFERHKFGMRLTSAGEVFFRRARAVQAELARARDEMEQLRGENRGVIAVGCSSASLLSFMPTIIKGFHSKYPDVRLRLLEGSFPMFETQIRDGLVDLYYGPIAAGFVDPALHIETLFDNARHIIGRRNHPLRSATTLADLVSAEWVTTPVAIDSDYEVNNVFTQAGLPPPHIVMEASSTMGLAMVLAATDMLAPVPQQWMEVPFLSTMVEQIPLCEVPKAPPICSVRRANAPLTPATEFFNDQAMRIAETYQRQRLRQGS